MIVNVLASVERNLPTGVSRLALPRIVQLQFFDDMRMQRRDAAAALLSMFVHSDSQPTQVFVFAREAQGGSFESLQTLWNRVPVRFIRGLFSLGTQLQHRLSTMGDDVIAQPSRLRQVLLNVLRFPEEEGLIIPADQPQQIPAVPAEAPLVQDIPLVVFDYLVKSNELIEAET